MKTLGYMDYFHTETALLNFVTTNQQTLVGPLLNYLVDWLTLLELLNDAECWPPSPGMYGLAMGSASFSLRQTARTLRPRRPQSPREHQKIAVRVKSEFCACQFEIPEYVLVGDHTNRPRSHPETRMGSSVVTSGSSTRAMRSQSAQLLKTSSW